MTRLNWERAAERDRMRESGTERADPPVGTVLGASTPLSKIMSCHACNSTEVVFEGPSGPHHGAIRCIDCGSFRWLKKVEAYRVRIKLELNNRR